ncbi:MAG TPA: ribose 5-phosphate isomerase A, partial [Alphaproteobacteria bacterium]|nr:ribose 5-phosphate isomerase A [Alphaproteobacteria bacterium]
LCHELGIPIGTLNDLGPLDMTVDGADEVDGELQLIKGGGGAHLREKIVASASDRVLIIVDESKI